MHKYRVFISYSHKDSDKVEKLVNILEENDLEVMWDKQLAKGIGFTGQIKDFISYSHVFMPFITESSTEWVHQEIGYAMALNVPVLPVTVDQDPGQMLHQLQAVDWTDDPVEMHNHLSKDTIHNLVNHTQRNSSSLFECAEYHEERTIKLVDYATKITDMGFHGHVRQIAGLSSFHIPNKHFNHPSFIERYSGEPASEFVRKWLLFERQIMEEHAKEKGCKLIINPYLPFGDKRARNARLKILLKFLKDESFQDVNIAIDKNLKEKNLIIIGNWFAAESVAGSLSGSQNTIFTRHAPTVSSKIYDFDQQFKDLSNGITGEESRKNAINVIEDLLASNKQNNE